MISNDLENGWENEESAFNRSQNYAELLHSGNRCIHPKGNGFQNKSFYDITGWSSMGNNHMQKSNFFGVKNDRQGV